MTWLSRLLPSTRTSGGLLAERNHRTRRNKSFRRRLTIDGLEDRTLLSNVSVVYSSGALLITGGTGNGDAFKITENSTLAGGQVTVSPLNAQTTINGTSVPVTSAAAVTAITVTLPGTNNKETVELAGPGKNTATTVKNVTFTSTTTGANLTLRIHDVNDPGALKVTAGRALNLTVDSSRFATADIEQSCCPVSVVMTNDTIPGSVIVNVAKVNNSNGNPFIRLDGDAFGSTSLTETYGSSDKIIVTNSSVRDLTARQGDGDNSSITIDTLIVSVTSFGVRTFQGNGYADVTTVNNVKDSISAGTSTPSNSYGRLGSSAVASIEIVQGNGGPDDKDHTTGEHATVSNVILPGHIYITQGNHSSDIASISNSQVGWMVSYGPNFAPALFNGQVSIFQGDGHNDSATVDTVTGNYLTVTQGIGHDDSIVVTGSTFAGNSYLTQGADDDNGDHGSNDSITVSNSVFGSFVQSNPFFVTDFYGNLYITQGDGFGATVSLDTVTANNVYITQGDSVNTPDCDPGTGDSVTIVNSRITSDLSIIQGDYQERDTSGAEIAAGNYSISISSTTVGGATFIYQGGGNNNLVLADFVTFWLDAFVGESGNNFVMATNVTVFDGSFFGSDYTVTSGPGTPDGNTFVDGGGNGGAFSVDPDDFNFA